MISCTWQGAMEFFQHNPWRGFTTTLTGGVLGYGVGDIEKVLGDKETVDTFLQHGVWAITIIIGIFALIANIQKQIDRRKLKRKYRYTRTPLTASPEFNSSIDSDYIDPMRTVPNKLITKNFTLYEIVEGRALPPRAIELNWKYYEAEYNHKEFKKLCLLMEEVRTKINKRFKSDINPSKNIGIVINSGFRCKSWEYERGRSGNSMHTIAAIDFVPSNASPKLSLEIFDFVMEEYKDLMGGLAIKDPRYKGDGSIESIGFIHMDLGTVRRWKY